MKSMLSSRLKSGALEQKARFRIASRTAQPALQLAAQMMHGQPVSINKHTTRTNLFLYSREFTSESSFQNVCNTMQYRQKVFERLCRKGDGGAAGEAAEERLPRSRRRSRRPPLASCPSHRRCSPAQTTLPVKSSVRSCTAGSKAGVRNIPKACDT